MISCLSISNIFPTTSMATSNPPNNDMELKNVSSTTSNVGFFRTGFILRLLATIFSIVAISLMVTSGQSTYLFNIEYKARYTYSSAYRFAVGADVVVCVCSMLSMAATLAFSKLNLASHTHQCNSFYFLVFLHDLALMALAISGCAASTAIGYVALNGQDQTGWAEICSRVDSFCNKVIASIALAYATFLCLFALTILSFVKPRVMPTTHTVTQIDIDTQPRSV